MDPIMYLAIPAVFAHAVWQAQRRKAARAAAMQRHLSARG